MSPIHKLLLLFHHQGNTFTMLHTHPAREINFMQALANGTLASILGADDDTAVFNGKDYQQYSTAVLYVMRKGLESKVREMTRGIPGVAEYGVPKAVHDELRAVKHALRNKEFYY